MEPVEPRMVRFSRSEHMEPGGELHFNVFEEYDSELHGELLERPE